MTEMSSVQNGPAPKPSFGFGQVLSDMFRTYFRAPIYFTSVSIIGLVAIFGLAGVASIPSMLAFEDAVVTAATTQEQIVAFAGFYLPFLAVLAIGFSLLIGVITRSAITVKLGQGVQFGRALKQAFLGILPMLAIGIILVIPINLGILFFVVPGLFLMAIFYAVVPVIVFEGRGLGAMGRSMQLTQGYRWILVGYSLVLTAIVALVSFAIVTLVVLLILPMSFLAANSDGAGVLAIVTGLLALLIYVVGYAVSILLPFIGSAMAYVRLREIKDGGGDELLAVFA